MPGEESLRVGQYYANARNKFWHIMGELFGAGLSFPYDQRVKRLQSAGVAIWDVLRECQREGSLDASITAEVANDFPDFFNEYPNITHVFFNGEKAERAFRCHTLPWLTGAQHKFQRLPSTSPAHAAMTIEEKVNAWWVVRAALSG
jgi:hypoxanthine-DNA glycosylase